MAGGQPCRRTLQWGGLTALDGSGTGSSPDVRVAILGGGASALAAAYGLTQQGGYDITVYQMGWRLGGKGASGRRLDDGSGRDQEHGLHVLGGFYHNAMGMLRAVYQDWNKVSSHPLDFDHAFIAQSLVHIMEDRPDGRFPVRFPFPENDKPFGCDPSDLPLVTVADTLLRWVLGKAVSGDRAPRGADYARDPAFLALLQSAIRDVSPPALESLRPDSGGLASRVDLSRLDEALNIIQGAHFAPPPPNAEHDPDYGILFEIAAVVARGIVVDGLWLKGFDAANGEEFAAWMTRHLLSQRARDSSYFRCGYDYAFAYIDGDSAQPAVAAGAALRGFLRMLLTYNHSVFAHMNGGMGEIVFVPLYEVLKSRGVKFEFFHRVDSLQLDADGTRLNRVVGVVQNTPVAASYDPLLLYNNERWVWPDKPIDAALSQHPPLPGRPEYLYECPWAQPATATPFELEQDRDFDVCILAISVGALGPICDDLANKIPAWRTMLQSSATTPTLSAQLWLSETTAALGWPNGPTVLTANRPALSTWADMSFLLPLERPSDSLHLSYFCGPCPRNYYAIPPSASNPGPPDLAQGCADTATWLQDNLDGLMPNAVPPASFASAPGGDELYVRVNSYPSDGYVLTLPGTVEHRLPPGGSDVTNLFLAGDWTKNGLDIGSFETAVLSGLLCARAITGTTQRFPGENDVVG